ncbi:hypothetical protein KC332_g8165 [Hortaea werneckii]|nr:hypothetical protein KC358_g7967 [Hortaea werneckii]KAI6915461.1 hypothetical protein KC348_g12022 [Hortaea werneckii]KAI6934014.1 hypothetical protein KC341_g7884 [Hortaea werneckii]KAI6965111.1 hypothetical protein KC321_g10280 [Hortaea werneckii]KAI7034012.1 hypothetical protein KC362_g8368 [Hortaea werneckii]
MSPPPSSQVHIFNPEGHPPQVPSYSHISSVPISSTHRLVSLAGQVGVPPTTTASDHIPSFPDQVRAALENVDRCLAAAGITKRDIVSNRQYVVKLQSRSSEDFEARERIFCHWWRSTEGEGTLPPPDTYIGVDSLANPFVLYEIEIQCVAAFAIVHPGLLNWIFLQIRITNFAALVWKTEDFAVVEWAYDGLQSTATGLVGILEECAPSHGMIYVLLSIDDIPFPYGDVAIGSIHECYWDIAWILASEQIESWNSNGGGDG